MLGIATLAPELRVLPYGAARRDDWLQQHPGVAVLRERGLVDPAGRVVGSVAERMRVLSAPDVEVAVLVSRGGPLTTAQVRLDDPSTWRSIPDDQLRIVLARKEGRWVSAVRAGDEVAIDDIAGGGIEWLAVLVTAQLDGIHPVGPSRMPAINVALDEMADITAQRAGLAAGAAGGEALLRALGVRGAALAELAELIDRPVAEAVMYARGYVDGQTRVGGSVLDVRDTEAGRVVFYRMAAVRGSGQDWMTIAAATDAQLQLGVRSVLASVDVANWETHRRM